MPIAVTLILGVVATALAVLVTARYYRRWKREKEEEKEDSSAKGKTVVKEDKS